VKNIKSVLISASMCVSALCFQTSAQANTIVEWAKSATAASMFDASYAASFATGSPDAKGCHGLNGQWATKGKNDVAAITLTYSKPTVPTLINVFQNNIINAVSKIEVSADGTTWSTVYVGDTTKAVAGSCMKTKGYDDVLIAPVSPNFRTSVTKVRVTVDQTTQGRAEIDAVQLIGKTAQTIPTIEGSYSHSPWYLRLPKKTSASLNITWTTSTPNVCSIKSGVLRGLIPGSCRITGTNAGNGSFTPVSYAKTIDFIY